MNSRSRIEGTLENERRARARAEADRDRYRKALEELVRREGFNFTSWEYAELARTALGPISVEERE